MALGPVSSGMEHHDGVGSLTNHLYKKEQLTIEVKGQAPTAGINYLDSQSSALKMNSE